jgi:hypothetical protein
MPSLIRIEFVPELVSSYGHQPADVEIFYGGPGYRRVKRLCIPDGELAVDHGTRIRITGAKAGRFSGFLVDPVSGQVTHLMMRKGPAWATKVVPVSISEVKRLGEREIYLRTDRAGIEAPPSVRA